VSRVPPGDSPGRVARAIGSVVARWMRQVQPVRSPVFAGPYRAHAIASVDELRDEMRMLAWRPVLLALCRTPSHYPHSSLRIALGHAGARVGHRNVTGPVLRASPAGTRCDARLGGQAPVAAGGARMGTGTRPCTGERPRRLELNDDARGSWGRGCGAGGGSAGRNRWCAEASRGLGRRQAWDAHRSGSASRR
jgi:hypothetical protein